MNIEKFLTAAIAVAHQSPGVGGRKNHCFRLGAVLVDRHIVAACPNDWKTNPWLVRYFKKPTRHAEAGAILLRGLEHCIGLTLFVARITRDGHMALAKPCQLCYTLSAEVGIKRIYYTITEQEYGVIKL